MYIIIDKDHRIFQTRMLTAATRAACDRGEISVVHINLEQLRIRGRNLPENYELYGGEWSDIQHWAPIELRVTPRTGDIPIEDIERAVIKVSNKRRELENK